MSFITLKAGQGNFADLKIKSPGTNTLAYSPPHWTLRTFSTLRLFDVCKTM